MTTIATNMEDPDTCDVLVVGLGPVGSVLTGLLAKQGLRVIAIDRAADIYPLPRAGSFDGETMRVLQMLGVADEIRSSCRVLEGYQILSASQEILLEFKMPAGNGPHGWDATYAFHQPKVERVLRDRLTQLGADVRVTTQLTSVAQTDSGISAQVVSADRPRLINAKYVVGCDGANSSVRDTIGGAVFDYGFSEYWLVIDAIVEKGDDLPQTPVVICDPCRPTMLSKMTGPRYRWEFMLKPGEDPGTFANEDDLRSLLAPWNTKDRIEVERSAIYRFRAMVAEQWRHGRMLIAGDAAHLMPPFLGQGMCSGIRDACNLAWKLAAVVDGKAGDALLDTYQQEREPHVRAIIERSIELGKAICVLDPQMAGRRNAGMLAMRAAGQSPPMIPLPPLIGGCFMGGRESGTPFMQPVLDEERLDDVLGDRAWLITRKPSTRALGSIGQFIVGNGAPGPFDRELAGWLDHQASEAVLVRPDRHIFGVGGADDLVAAWQTKLLATAELRGMGT